MSPKDASSPTSSGSASPPCLEPLLAQAAVTTQQVEANNALIRVTDQIALETVAVAIPTEFVDRLNDELQKVGSETASDGRGSVDSEATQKADSEATQKAGKRGAGGGGAVVAAPDVIDIRSSAREFVEAILPPDARSRCEADSVLPMGATDEILDRAGVDRRLLDEPDAAVSTAVVAAPFDSVAVVAEIISGEAAAEALVAPAEGVVSVATDSALAPIEEKKAQQTEVEQGFQPLSYIIAHHPVWIATGFPTATEIDESIAHLDNLIHALRNVQEELYYEGLSPGFETRGSAKVWFAKHAGSVYETLPSVNSHMNHGPATPVPSPAAAVRYYTGIRDTWLERKRYVEQMGEGTFCSCIKDWDHSDGAVLAKLSNQSLEQDMVREASDAVTVRMAMAAPGSMKGEAWDRLYDPEHCPSPESQNHLYVSKTSLRVVGGRDDYVGTLAAMALRAENTIDIATCYLFPQDPAQRYILLDLLPYVARTRGVTVRLLCDMMPIESSLLKSVIREKKELQADVPGAPPKKSRSGLSPLGFLTCLPPEAPAFSDEARDPPASPMDFIASVLQAAYAIPNERMQIKWWCARDSQEKYRIKNHAKCAVLDGGATRGKARGVAFMGGSNVCPSLESGDSDLDLLVSGSDVVNKIQETFDFLWDSMCDAAAIASTDIIDTAEPLEEEAECDEEPDSAGKFPKQDWLDNSCRVALIRSEPCSAGSDAIFRHVLGAISSAKSSVMMCMGHSNKPMALARALGDAVRRGVHVQILVNSIYSCDLRVNQRDLFRSIQNLLAVAPGVEVWTTALRSHRRIAQASLTEERRDKDGASNLMPEEDKGDEAPPFLHSKYTVVDGRWVAAGSWNAWTRSAFYEIEHELLIESDVVAAKLAEKFERERQATSVLLTTPEECALWCPTGCKLCMPFGPFYV